MNNTTRKGTNSVVPEEMNKSLFNRVLKRRRSRQSTDAFNNVDFDYAGNSAEFSHLIKKRIDQGEPNNM
jgi:hypothetical protein